MQSANRVSATEGRLAGMDALRGGAMLLGVFVHAAISYIPSNLVDLRWGIRETASSPAIDALFWWVHACRLPLFFVIAGFFAALVVETKGTRGFASHRLRRLFVPYIVGLVTLLPPAYLYFWACGVLTGHLNHPSIFAFEIAPDTLQQLFGPMHLWFLQDLLILSAIFIAVRHLANGGRKSPDADAVSHQGANAPRAPVISLLAPLALAVPTALLLWHDGRPLMAHANTFVPDGIRLLYYGYFFAIGTGLYRQRKSLTDTFAWPLTHLTLSLPAGLVMLALIPGYLHGSLGAVESLLLAASAACMAWLSIFGFLGLALRSFQGRHPLANYLADASYWVYLCHLPIVCVLQLDLYGVDWPAEVKCGLVVAVTAAFGLGSYHTFVRYTAIGTCLHGARQRPRHGSQ